MTAGWILLAPALFVSAPPAALGHSAGLSAAAAASGRPPECGSTSRRALARGPSVWETARVPSLGAYCDLMARAHTQLGTEPKRARLAAEEADKLLPGHAAPAVILARAALALGEIDAAARSFARAREIEPRSVEDPSTLRDLARVLVRTGKRDEALAVYRALVPRADLLGTASDQVSVLLEAAHVSMAVEGAKPKAPKARLDEAIAYLREARQRPTTQLAGEVLLSLGLALDRAGERDEADAALADAQRAGLRLGAVEYAAAPEEKVALTALATEASDRSAAQKSWESYLAGPGGKGPWAAAARARLDLLKKGGGARPAKARAPAKPGKTR